MEVKKSSVSDSEKHQGLKSSSQGKGLKKTACLNNAVPLCKTQPKGNRKNE